MRTRSRASSFLAAARRALRALLGLGLPPGTAGPLSPPPGPATRPGTRPGTTAGGAGHPAYPGDHVGPVAVSYAPVDDDHADPGEVVWAWVPYEEDHSRGKDRPVLVVGRSDRWLLALPLTSQDHDRDATQEAAAGRRWTDVGSGAWDERRRPSEARLDRVLRLDPTAVRRTGTRLDRAVFDRVVQELATVRGA